MSEEEPDWAFIDEIDVESGAENKRQPRGILVSNLIDAARRRDPVLVDNEDDVNFQRSIETLKKKLGVTEELARAAIDKCNSNTYLTEHEEATCNDIMSLTNKFKKKGQIIKDKETCKKLFADIFNKIPKVLCKNIYDMLTKRKSMTKAQKIALAAQITGLAAATYKWGTIRVMLTLTTAGAWRWSVKICDEFTGAVKRGEGHEWTCKPLRICAQKWIMEMLKKRAKGPNEGIRKIDGGRKRKKSRKRRRKRKTKKKQKSRRRKRRRTKKH